MLYVLSLLRLVLLPTGWILGLVAAFFAPLFGGEVRCDDEYMEVMHSLRLGRVHVLDVHRFERNVAIFCLVWYVRVCVCMYECIIRMYVCVCVFVCMCMCACMYVCMQICMYVRCNTCISSSN